MYLLNSFLPWSRGLFGRQQHAWFLPFWISVALLHWASVALVVLFVRRAGYPMKDVGLVTRPKRLVTMLIVLTAIGVGLVQLRERINRPAPSPSIGTTMLPATMGERFIFVDMSTT